MQGSPATVFAAKLSAGFALVVLPVSAQIITTDISGLEANEISIPTVDGQITGYGGKDPGIPLDTVEQMCAAQDGWKRMQEWFKKYGAA